MGDTSSFCNGTQFSHGRCDILYATLVRVTHFPHDVCDTNIAIPESDAKKFSIVNITHCATFSFNARNLMVFRKVGQISKSRKKQDVRKLSGKVQKAGFF